MWIDHRYQITSKVGEGGLGVVYRAIDTLSGEVVAVKQVRGESCTLLEREFLAMVEFPEHPNIARVFDYGRLPGGRPYYTMEFIAGTDLRSYMAGRDIDTLYPLLVQICEGLSFIHANGYIHGDIKPENLLVTGEGRGEARIKIIDFGLSHAVREGGRGLQGTPHYMAPELLRDEAPDLRVDLYALGVVLYEILTGRKPFPGESVREILRQHLTVAPPPPHQVNPGVPEKLSGIVMTLLHKDPQARFPSAGALLEALGPIVPLRAHRSTSRGVLLNAPLIGREKELQHLLDLFEGVGKGEATPQCVVISGGEGMGKRRLLREFKYHVQIGGGTWFEARCRIGSSFSSLAPLMEKLLHVALTGGMRRQESDFPLLKQIWPTLPLGGSAAVVEEGLSPDAARIRRFSAVAAFLRSLIERGIVSTPLLLTLSDLHFADPDTLELLRYLIRALEGIPLLFALSYVPGFHDFVERRILDLGPERVTSLRLSPLTPAQQKRLLDARLGHSDLPEDFYAWAYRHTEGNPLWVEMLIHDLIERGVLLHEQGYWRVRPTFRKAGEPEVFQTFFASVVDRLTDEERMLLEHAAVIGETFPEDLLAELVHDRWPREEFLRILHGLIHRHRVIEELPEGADFRFRFVRSHLQTRLYEAFSCRRRRRLHAKIGAWFLERGEERAALEHLLRGGREARRKAFALARRLGRYTAEQGAPEQAVRCYEAALQALRGQPHEGNIDEKLDILEGLGDLYMRLGRIPEGERAFLRLLRQPLAPERRAKILWKMGKLLRKSQPARALRWLRRAKAALEGREGEETALLVEILGDTGFVLHLQNRQEAARSCWEAGRKAAGRIEDPAQRKRLLGFIHYYLATAAFTAREMAQARHHYDEVLHYWRDMENPVEISKVYNGLGLLAFWQQRFEEAKDYFLQCIGAMERIGNRLDAGRIYANLGLVLQYSNRNREALPYHEQHFQVSREVGDLRGQLYSSLNLGNVHSLLGDFERAIEHFQRSLEIAKRHGNDFEIFHCRFNLGRIRIRQGAYGEARGHLTGPFKDLPFDHEALRRLYLATIDLETDVYPKAYSVIRKIVASFEEGREHSDNQMVRLACLAEGHAFLIEGALRRGDLTTAGKDGELLEEILAMPMMEMLIESKLQALLTLANLAMYRGEGARAEEALECALKLARGGELRYEEGKILRGMAEFHIASEREFDAEDACNESLALLEPLGARHEIARSWMTKATLLERMYFVEEALDLLHRAAETLQQIGAKYDLARCSQRIAKLLMSRGAREEAAHHQTKAAQLYAAVGCPEEIEPLPEAALH